MKRKEKKRNKKKRNPPKGGSCRRNNNNIWGGDNLKNDSEIHNQLIISNKKIESELNANINSQNVNMMLSQCMHWYTKEKRREEKRRRNKKNKKRPKGSCACRKQQHLGKGLIFLEIEFTNQ